MKRALAPALASTALVATEQAGPDHPSPAADGASSRLLQKHLAAFTDNDLDAVVADYTADAVLVAPDGKYTGRQQIREFFRKLMVQFPKGASTLALDKATFHDDMVYFTWHGKTPTLDVPFATDTMIVRDGRIARQTFGGMLLPVQR